MGKYVCLLFLLSHFSRVHADEPNPPQWPDSVGIFNPAMSSSDIESVVTAAFELNGGDPRTSCSNGQFSDKRFAFLFMPGEYVDIDVPVGYYTSVYGLGLSPLDTLFTGGKGPYCEEACGIPGNGALDTFWRSAENFHSATNYTWSVGTGMTWAVSQASPLRNVKLDRDLLLFEYLDEYCCGAGYASGGWVSGMDVGGTTKFGSQQQFMVRSSTGGSFEKPAWNGVFLGVSNPPSAQCGEVSNGQSSQPSISVEPVVPLIAEKPFISSTNGGKTFTLVVPAAKVDAAAGVPWDSSGYPGARLVDFSQVYVTKTTDSSEIINGKLSAGLHVVISPGIYQLDSTLKLNFEGQVLLGLGLATLIAPPDGGPCIKIGDIPGVRVAGLLLEAGPWETTGAMLQVGEGIGASYSGSASKPTILTDVFARVGGPSTGVGPVGSMVLVQSGYTVIDNTWLWRADHTAEGLVYNSENPVKNGLVVEADNVFAYGLAAEHTIEDNVVWNGDNGTTYFYQAEIMYDYLGPTWEHSCYRLGGKVVSHRAAGIGCYSFFRDASSVAPIGIDIGAAIGPDVFIGNAVNVWLNGVEDSGIENLLPGDSLAVDDKVKVQYRC